VKARRAIKIQGKGQENMFLVIKSQLRIGLLLELQSLD
jgi:hypothetical protein